MIDSFMIALELQIAKILSLIVLGVGVIVTIGWILNVIELEEVLPHSVNMKFCTSLSFIFSGIILYFIAKMQEDRLGVSEIAITASGMVIFLLMATLLVSNLTGVYIGIENLFVNEKYDEKTTVLGRPAVSTMIDFVMIVTAGVFSLSNYVKLKKLSFWMGLAILSSGSISIIGYVTNLPFLYSYIPGWSTGMAIHTSMSFILVGIALMVLRSHYSIENKAIRTIRLKTKLTSLFLISSVIPTIFIGTLSYNLAKSSEPITTLGSGILMLVSVTIMGITVFALITSKFFSEPIIRLKRATEQLSKENFDVIAEEQSTDDFGDLGRSFNQMVKNLKATREKLVTVEKLELSEKRALDQYKELKKIHEVLSNTEKRYRNLYEYSPDLLRTISEDGTILDCNNNYTKSLGYTKDEVVGKSIFEHTAKKVSMNYPEEWKNGKILVR